MGHVVHHAIVVTGWKEAAVKQAHDVALELCMNPTEIVESHINSNYSFLCPPDGSKSGWPEDADGDSRRAALVKWLMDNWDGGWVDWVEVAYGADERKEPRIVTSSADACEDDDG